MSHDSHEDDEYRLGFGYREGASHQDCDRCGESILLDEDIVLVQLVYPRMTQEAELVFDLLMGTDEYPLVRSLFFHFSCYEEVEQELQEYTADTLPIEEAHSVLSCDYCSSSIRMGEVCATATQGEISHSPRLTHTTTFIPAQEADGTPAFPAVACVVCIGLLAEAVFIEEWSTISQKGECSACSSARCWRAGKCSCSCHKHT